MRKPPKPDSQSAPTFRHPPTDFKIFHNVRPQPRVPVWVNLVRNMSPGDSVIVHFKRVAPLMTAIRRAGFKAVTRRVEGSVWDNQVWKLAADYRPDLDPPIVPVTPSSERTDLQSNVPSVDIGMDVSDGSTNPAAQPDEEWGT